MPRTFPLSLLLTATFLATGCSNLAARQETPTARSAQEAPPKPSVAQIQASIVQDPEMAVSVRRGWTMAKDTKGFVLWTFTPDEHPAHPSAIRRQIVNRDGSARIEMSVFCESSQSACDALVEQFKDKNRLIKNRLRAKHRMTDV